MQRNLRKTAMFKLANQSNTARYSYPSRSAADSRMQQSVSWIDSDQAKRVFDIVGATLLLVFLLPIFILVPAIISMRRDGPIFFGHQRLGWGGVPFDCLKFRTMCTDGDRVLAEYLKANPAQRLEWEQTQKLQRDPRVLTIGRLLRKSSLDELPQLINVIRGEMSLVGPRPIVSDEAANYGNDFAYYLAMRPGITGLWQVSGRNNTTYEERVALDVRYVRERTMIGDLRILMRTVVVVLTGHGAY